MQDPPTPPIIEDDEASVRTDHDGLYLSAGNRKAAKCTVPFELKEDEILLALPEEIPSRKKRRVEEPLVPLRRSSRILNTTSSTGSSDPPPPIDTVENGDDDADNDDDADDDDVDVDVGDFPDAYWKERLSELADYRKINAHCNVPRNHSENTKLANWVNKQRTQYRWHVEGKKSYMTPLRVKELESLDFEWSVCVAAWEDRLSELADYRKNHGDCNVPKRYTNSRLGEWVNNQRTQYRLRVEGKKSSMTLSRIEALENMNFEWDHNGTAWEDRLSELAKYLKNHGDCNVPYSYNENTKLASWVNNQRTQYRLRVEGKKSCMTLSRIEALENMDFKWKIHAKRKGKQRKQASTMTRRVLARGPRRHSRACANSSTDSKILER